MKLKHVCDRIDYDMWTKVGGAVSSLIHKNYQQDIYEHIGKNMEIGLNLTRNMLHRMRICDEIEIRKR